MYSTRPLQTFCITCSFFIFMHFASADQTQKGDLWDDVDTQSAAQTNKPAAQEAKPETKAQYADPEIQMWAITKARDMYREQPPEETFRDFRQGSVDFWVKYDPKWEAKDDSGTIISLSNGYDTLFAFSMSAEGDAIYMENSEDDEVTGAKSRRNAVNFDFNDGLIHHVALVTEGKLTTMYVDGKSEGKFSLGYSIPTDAQGQRIDLQLSIGSLDGRKNMFQGQVGAIRIWGVPLDGNLLLKAAFMRDDELLNQAWAKSYLIAYQGNESGQKSNPNPNPNLNLNIIPNSFRRPEGVWVEQVKSKRKQAERTSFTDKFKNVDGEKLNYEYVPQAYTQILVVPRDSELARYVSASPAVSSSGQTEGSNIALAGYSKMAGKQMNGVALAPALSKSLNECADACSSSTKCKYFNYISVVKNKCHLIGDMIKIETTSVTDLYTKIATSSQQSQVANAPRNATTNPTGLKSPLAVQKPKVPISNTDLPMLVALSFDPEQEVKNQVRVEAFEASQQRNLYKSASGSGTILVNRQTSFIKDNQTTFVRTSSLALPKKTDGNMKDPFLVANHVRSKEAILRGYDPLTLDPYYLNDPDKGDIFKISPYGFDTGANKVVPLGIELVDKMTGGGRVKTETAMSQSELQQMLGGSVSASMGFNTPKGSGSMTGNARFKNITNKTTGNEVGYTFSQSHHTKFVLLLDKSKINMTQEFRDAVENIAESPSPQNLNEFIKSYGTHYPHAVAMGGRIVNLMEFNNQEWGEGNTYEGGIGVAVEAKIGPEALNVYGKGSLDLEGSHVSNFKAKMEKSTENFEYIGGTGGADKTSWNVPDDSTTPIYLDLRILSELLAPPFFSDPKVIFTLRPIVHQAIFDHVKANKGNISDKKLVPKNIARPETVNVRQECQADDKTFRHDYNTDDKKEGGGVWAQFKLPKLNQGQFVAFKAGCVAHSHYDGPIDAMLECNRVCWEQTHITCDAGSWKDSQSRKPNKLFSHDSLCHSSGELIQENLVTGKGTSPWRAEESRNAYLKALEPVCKALPKGMPGRPADCPN